MVPTGIYPKPPVFGFYHQGGTFVQKSCFASQVSLKARALKMPDWQVLRRLFSRDTGMWECPQTLMKDKPLPAFSSRQICKGRILSPGCIFGTNNWDVGKESTNLEGWEVRHVESELQVFSEWQSDWAASALVSAREFPNPDSNPGFDVTRVYGV